MGDESVYIQYGVPKDWANDYAAIGLSVATFKATPKKFLVQRYEVPEGQVLFVKRCLRREPVDEGLVEQLLSNNLYTCCVCEGVKSKSYIIHHIEGYSKTKDNSYSNLAVLCLIDHDLAHREGRSLTQKITVTQIRRAKSRWEKKVEARDVQKACNEGVLSEVDFVNPQRILDLYESLFHEVPVTNYSATLVAAGILLSNGEFDSKFIKEHSKDPAMPFMFFGPGGAWQLNTHYVDVFKQILTKVKFEDLDNLLRVSAIKKGVIGTYCYYVGGLYGKMPELPITSSTAPTSLYFHRKKFWIDWKVDARFMTSNSSLHRLPDHMQYQVYGIIRGVREFQHKGRNYIRLDIRPYLFGMPSKTKMRVPAIHLIKKYDEHDFDDEGDPW